MKKIIITLSSLIFLSGILFLIFYLRNENKTIENSSQKLNIEQHEIIEETKEEVKDENITEITKNDNNDVKNDSISIYDTNKNNLESHNVSNSNVIKNDNKETKQVEEKQIEPTKDITIHETKDEEKKVEETTKVIEEVRDDIVDTNSWFYSIHQGQIDTYTQDNCLSAGNEIAFIDTVDINYYRCYEVTSTTGKVLGYYLNIFCNSDNCNRYKTQINMSNYK